MNQEAKNKEQSKKAVKPEFIFGKQNYMLMIIAVVVIALGFILMSGSENIYGSLKITIAPILVLAGFGVGIYAIMKKGG